jgi:alpha-ribazole phosphatase
MDTLVDLLRHGEPEGGRAYRGNSIDDPLTEKGWFQMRSAVRGFDGWETVATSPLQRCRSFADELGHETDSEVVIEQDFREVGFGEWEGKTPDEIIARNPEEYEAFYKDPANCRPVGAEPLEAFTDRVINSY